MSLHPDSIQLDEPLEVAFRYARARAASEVRRAADDLLADPYDRRALYERADEIAMEKSA
jgi:hypothetical protein